MFYNEEIDTASRIADLREIFYELMHELADHDVTPEEIFAACSNLSGDVPLTFDHIFAKNVKNRIEQNRIPENEEGLDRVQREKAQLIAQFADEISRRVLALKAKNPWGFTSFKLGLAVAGHEVKLREYVLQNGTLPDER